VFAIFDCPVKLIEGVSPTPQKQEMIRKLTDAMGGSWGIGGKALSTNDVKSMSGGS
jgi:hypothetical protein